MERHWVLFTQGGPERGTIAGGCRLDAMPIVASGRVAAISGLRDQVDNNARIDTCSVGSVGGSKIGASLARGRTCFAGPLAKA